MLVTEILARLSTTKGRRNNGGQTILELFFFLIFISGFFAMVFYLNSAFEISQKQTMLLRNQAFIELGNHSAFTRGPQGKDDTKKGNSRLDFVLGKKTEGTMANLDKNEDFQKAVKGELEVDVTHAVKDDEYWTRYHFPKDKTKLVWLPGRDNLNAQPVVQMDNPLQQTLSIVHNRSININSAAVPAANKTGLISGSMLMKDYIAVANLKVPTAYAMRDNVDALKDALRQLVKNDPSLANEAEQLERTVNATDSLSGSAQAVLLSTAMSVIISSLGDAIGAMGSEGASGGASSFGDNFLKSLTGNFTSPAQAAAAAANGTLLSGPLGTALAPFRGAVDGFTNATTGLAQGGLIQTAQGIGQMLQTASLVGSLAGQDMSKVSMAANLLQAPAAFQKGLADLSSLNSSSGLKDVLMATSETMAPVQMVVGYVAPKVGVYTAEIGMAMNLATAGAGAIDSLSNISSGTLTAIETTKQVGAFVTNVGAVGSALGGMTGNQELALMSGYVGMAGGAIAATGVVAETTVKLSVDGKIPNPIDVAGALVKKNIDNVGKTWNGFTTAMEKDGAQIATNMDRIFNPKADLKNPDAVAFVNSASKNYSATANVIDNAVKGVDQNSLANANIVRVTNAIDEMSQKVTGNMIVNGDAAGAALAAQYIQDMKATAVMLDQASTKGTTVDAAILAKGTESSEKLRAMLGDGSDGAYFADHPDAQSQMKDYAHNQNTREVQDTLLNSGMTLNDWKIAKADQSKVNGLAGAAGFVGGDRRRLSMLEKNQAAIRDIANIKTKVDDVVVAGKQQEAMADGIRKVVAGMPINGYIVTADPDATREDFKKAEGILRSQLSTMTDQNSFQYRDTLAAADKLATISSNSQQFTSAREQFYRIEADVAIRAEKTRQAAAWARRMQSGGKAQVGSACYGGDC